MILQSDKVIFIMEWGATSNILLYFQIKFIPRTQKSKKLKGFSFCAL